MLSRPLSQATHYTALGTWHTPGTTHCSRRTFLLEVPPSNLTGTQSVTCHSSHTTRSAHCHLLTLTLALTLAWLRSQHYDASRLSPFSSFVFSFPALLLPPPFAFPLPVSLYPSACSPSTPRSRSPRPGSSRSPLARCRSRRLLKRYFSISLPLPLRLHLPQSTPGLSFQPARLLRPRLSSFHRVSINLALWNIESTRPLKQSTLPRAAASTHFAHPPHRQPALAALSCSSRRPSGSCSRCVIPRIADSFVHRPTHGRASPGLAAQLSINSSPSQHMSSLPS